MNYYIIGNTDTTTTAASLEGGPYEGYTIRTVDQMNDNPLFSATPNPVGDGDNVVVSGTVDTNLTLLPASGSPDGFAVNMTILDNTNTVNVDFGDTIYLGGLDFSDPTLTVSVPGPGGAAGVSIGGSDNIDSMNVTVAAGASIGDITGGEGPGNALTLTAGDGATLGNIITGDQALGIATADDTITLGDNVTVGAIRTGPGNDTITIGENSQITSEIVTGTDNIAVADADTLIIGSGSTVTSFINTNAGDDTIILGDNVTLNGGTNAINTYLGDDSITIGEGATIGNPIVTGGGSDTVTASSGSFTVDMGIVTPNNDSLEIVYGTGNRATFEQYMRDNGFTYDAAEDRWFAGSNVDGFTYGGATYDNIDYVVGIACFTAGTMIDTADGPRAIETLAPGDRVRTRDNGFQAIRWIGSTELSAADLAESPNLRPIRIAARSLGMGAPETDLIVSPQHRVLVSSKITQRMFGTPEVLVAAKQLLRVDGVDIVEDDAPVSYFHMLFDQHEVVLSDGAWTESLYTGAEALKSVGAEACEEIFTLFPELRHTTPDHRPAAARELVSGRKGRTLAHRHVQNRKSLLSSIA